MNKDRRYYKYNDNGRIYLVIIGSGFVFPHYLSFEKPTKFSKKYRGLYRINLPISVPEFNSDFMKNSVQLSQAEFNREADILKAKSEMAQELLK